MEWWQTLLTVFVCLVGLFMTGLPIFVCFLLINAAAMLMLMGSGGIGLFVNSMLETSTAEALVAIPVFVILGELLFRTGGVRIMFEAFDSLIGVIRGRLYVVAIGVAAFMGAISGSALASVAVLGRFVYPIMIQRGCDRRLATGTILSGATLDAVIPPSIVAIILATVANISVADFLVAGIGPGLTLAFCFAGYAVIRTWLNPSLDSRRTEDEQEAMPTYGQRLRAALPIVPLFAIIFLVLGLVMMGIAQPTEAAATGIAGTLVLSMFLGTFSFKMIAESCYSAAITTSTVLIIIVSSKLFSQVLAFTGAATGLVNFSTSMNLDPWIFFAAMMVTVFILCMFLDQLALILIMVPIYAPLVQHFGFDPIWFWMMFLINILFGGITPPVGYTLFVFKSVVPDITSSDLYAAVLPVIAVAIFGIIVMAIFPSIITFLPSLN